VVRAGATRPVRPAPSPGGSLWRRIADRFRTEPVDPAAAADPLVELVSRVKEDLAAIEVFLSSGERNPRIRINRDG
jgi:RecB family exonuclease